MRIDIPTLFNINELTGLVYDHVMRVKTDHKREEILLCATQVFGELGFERASMAEIAARMGGSKATLYGYFGSKEELFCAVTKAEAIAHLEPAIKDLQSADVDIRTALRRFGEKFLSFMVQPNAIAVYRMVLGDSARPDIGRRFYTNGPQRGLEFLTAYLRQAREQGALRAAEPYFMAQHLFGLLECELLPRCRFGVEREVPTPTIINETVARAIDVFLAAYGTSEAKPTGV